MFLKFREGASVYPGTTDRDFTEFFAARAAPGYVPDVDDWKNANMLNTQE
jgi:hypothetical protein